MELRELTAVAVVIRICAAVLIGGIIGLERGLKNRAAGLRTYMLVCTGACLVMLTNQYVCQVFHTGDPVRMGAQVVSGIGFLGAGTIIVTRRNQIKGLTTAAGLWAAAGVGLALGIGFYEAAITGALAVFFVMTILQKMDNNMHRKARALEVYIELTNECPLGDFLREMRAREIEVRDIQREQEPDADTETRAYISTMKLRKRRNHIEVIDDIRTIPGVAYLDEL